MKKLLVISHAAVLDVNRTIFRELARRAEFEIVLLAPEKWKGDLIADLNFEVSSLTPNFTVLSSPIYFSGNGSLYFYKPGWKKKLKNWQPDLIFVDEEPWSLSAMQVYSSFSKVSRKVFFTKQNLLKKLPFPFSFIQKWIFSSSVAAFSVASEVTEVLKKKHYNGPILELPHSYDPLLFRSQDPDAIAAERNRIGIPPDKFVISYFGRLAEEKGVLDLLAVQEKILTQPQFAHCYLLWVGNGPLENHIKTRLTKFANNQAAFSPALKHDEVGRALAVSDLLVLPSRTVKNWKEQFGRILVEAMACGSAVLGSSSGEIPHLIDRSGGGTWFLEGDLELLQSNLEDLILNPSLVAKYKTQGQAFVSRFLTHSSVADLLSNELRKLL